MRTVRTHTHTLHSSHADLVLCTELKYEIEALSWVTCFSWARPTAKSFRGIPEQPKMCSVTSVVTRSGASNPAHYTKLKLLKKRKRSTALVMQLPARICRLNRLGCRVTVIVMKEYGEAVPQYASTANESRVRPVRRRAAARGVRL